MTNTFTCNYGGPHDFASCVENRIALVMMKLKVVHSEIALLLQL